MQIRLTDNLADVLPTLRLTSWGALTAPAWWRAVAFLADNLASFPRSVRLEDGAGQGQAATPHPLSGLLRRAPNAYQSSFIFWRTWFANAAHRGNAYARIERDELGRPAALHLADPGDVSPFRYQPEGAAGPEQWYLFAGQEKATPGADVLHLQALGLDGQAGLDPVAVHADTLSRAATVDRYVTRYLQRGTVIRGAIEFPAAVNEEKLERMRTTLRAHFYGIDAERDVLLLTDGAKLNNATLSPAESQIVQIGAQATKQIAQITGVPPEFLYELSEAKYNASVEQAGQTVVRYTFRPWIEQAEDELTLKLLTAQERADGYTVRINPDALLRGDTAAQVNAVIQTTNAGLRTANEGRALLDLPASADPSADKLRLLGDTAPQPQPPAQ